MIAFFHQNEVETQGGVERFLSTLISSGSGRDAVLVTEAREGAGPNRLSVDLIGSRHLPKLVRFVLAVMFDWRRIRKELAARRVSVLEFSRVEYAFFAWMFPGRKVFTFHGTGPLASVNPVKWAFHNLVCCLLPAIASGLQVVGRDNSAIPRPVRRWFDGRIVHIDAWYDDRFRPSPLPPVHGAPFVVFYSGRLTKEKNPELLFEIIRQAPARLPFPVEFRYFGANSAQFEAAGLGDVVRCEGLLGPEELAAAIGRCHTGLLCSKTEGSPFAMIEALACGRCFVASPIPGLLETYRNVSGAFFASRLDVEAFLEAITQARDFLLTEGSATAIARGVEGRSQTNVTRAVIDRLKAPAENEAQAMLAEQRRA